ncbi:MAG TPA: ribose-phosphate pyrophosphokinase [Gammaproteobacteria bacterium]|nr:ribose-phosphate pyrophosphokinase [Gammaproteobacteria bacterium]
MNNDNDPKLPMMIFNGNANPELADSIAKRLNVEPGQAMISKFSDGETQVEILQSVRNRDVFVVQPTSAPTNDNLMELILMIDALREASARQITAVIPYFGYARQDRRPDGKRAPISAKVVANQITAAGATRVVTVDLHADQIQGFFSQPVDNLYATPVFLKDIRQKYDSDITIVSPDAGGIKRARELAKWLPNSQLAVIDKRRPKANEVEVMNIMGEVRGRDCVIIDDIIDTGGTLCQAAVMLKKNGAASVSAYITHPVLSGRAIENINASVLDELIVTDTIPLSEAAKKCPRIRTISLSELLAEAIHRIHYGKSLTELAKVSCEQAAVNDVQSSPRNSPSLFSRNGMFAEQTAAKQDNVQVSSIGLARSA